MMKFVKKLVLVLAVLAGAFLAVGAFLDRCAKAVQLQPKQEPPKRKPCEEAICAVDQCMPY